MDGIKLVLAGLATWQITEVLHHAELTLPIRNWTSKNTQTGVLRSFVSRAFNCPFCLSHWVAGLTVVLLALKAAELPYCGWLEHAVTIFAVTRLANLGNDLTYHLSRTPKFEVESQDDITVTDDPPDDAESADLSG